MNFIRKIAPFLLLSIFSIAQLHDIIPHLHHDHHNDVVDTTLTHHHYDNYHEKSFKDVHNYEITSEFIAHFFDSHSHQDAPHEHIVLTNDIKVQSKSKNDLVQTNFDYKVIVPEEERKPISQGVYKALYSKSYLSSFSLRGPPSLV